MEEGAPEAMLDGTSEGANDGIEDGSGVLNGMSEFTTEDACDGALDAAVLVTDEGDTERGAEVTGMKSEDGAKLKSADEAISVADDGKVGWEERGGSIFEVVRITSMHAPVVYPNLMNTPESLQSNGFNTMPLTVTTKFPSVSTENTFVKELIGRDTSLLLDKVTKSTYVLPAVRSSSEM